MKLKFEQFENEIENPKIEIKGFAEVVFTTEKHDKQAVLFDIAELQQEVEKLIMSKLQKFEVK